MKVVKRLKSIARLEAVSGNCDPPEITDVFPRHKIINLDGLKIGLMHGSGAPSITIETAKKEFESKVDIALFGHTHVSCHLRSGPTLFFNPGSLTEGRGNGSGYGLLHLEREPWAETIET